jgi:hypothetical protein
MYKKDGYCCYLCGLCGLFGGNKKNNKNDYMELKENPKKPEDDFYEIDEKTRQAFIEKYKLIEKSSRASLLNLTETEEDIQAALEFKYTFSISGELSIKAPSDKIQLVVPSTHRHRFYNYLKLKNIKFDDPKLINCNRKKFYIFEFDLKNAMSLAGSLEGIKVDPQRFDNQRLSINQ